MKILTFIATLFLLTACSEPIVETLPQTAPVEVVKPTVDISQGIVKPKTEITKIELGKKTTDVPKKPKITKTTTKVNKTKEEGPDLAYSCATVRLYVNTFGTASADHLAKEHGLTKKQIRQAKDCLKGNNNR